MKKYIFTIVIFIFCLALLSMFYSCTHQSNSNEDEPEKDTTVREPEGEGANTSVSELGMSFRSLEEFENTLIVSRKLQRLRDDIGGSHADILNNPRAVALREIYDVSDDNFRSIVWGYLNAFDNYYIPNFQFDGFELVRIGVGQFTINYSFMPIGEPPLNFSPSQGVGIAIRLETLGGEMRDLMAPLISQRQRGGREFIFEDGLLYESRGPFREIVRQIPNTTIRMRITIPRDFGDYEFLRDFALSEFVPDNIMCVDEMVYIRTSVPYTVTITTPDLMFDATLNTLTLNTIQFSAEGIIPNSVFIEVNKIDALGEKTNIVLDAVTLDAFGFGTYSFGSAPLAVDSRSKIEILVYTDESRIQLVTQLGVISIVLKF